MVEGAALGTSGVGYASALSPTRSDYGRRRLRTAPYVKSALRLQCPSVASAAQKPALSRYHRILSNHTVTDPLYKLTYLPHHRNE